MPPHTRRPTNSLPSNKGYALLNSGPVYAVVWTVYVIIGAWVTMVLETETWVEEELHEDYRRYTDLINSGPRDADVEEMSMLRRKLHELCPHNSLQGDYDITVHGAYQAHSAYEKLAHLQQLNHSCPAALIVQTSYSEPPYYNYVDAIYYIVTLVTTIGYGYVYPKSVLARLFSVVFALVGIPFTFVVLRKNSNVLSNMMLLLYNTLKQKYSSNFKNTKLMVSFATLIYLGIGLLLLVFIPSVVFVYLEEWSYGISLYYCFITLSTIGLGDLVAGVQTYNWSGFYKICIMVWIMIGLGYFVTVLTFLQKALEIKLVPKRIRVQFKSLLLAKQAEFLRQLMIKVRETKLDCESSRAQLVEDNRNTLSLMAEVAGALTNELHNIKGVTLNSTTIGQRIDVSAGSTVDQSKISNFSLPDLLCAEVVLRTPKVNLLRFIIEQQDQDTEKDRTCSSVGDINARKDLQSEEITLPLKDVLGLVTLVANLECHIGGNLLLDSNLTNSMISMDAKLPLQKGDVQNLQQVKNIDGGRSYTAFPVETHDTIEMNPSENTNYMSDDGSNSIRTQRTGSCLNAFLDTQTRQEYIEVGKEDEELENDDEDTLKG